MNKKVSTLFATGLFMFGSLLNSAFAAEEADFRKATATDLIKSGLKVYLGKSDKAHFVTPGVDGKLQVEAVAGVDLDQEYLILTNVETSKIGTTFTMQTKDGKEVKVNVTSDYKDFGIATDKLDATLSVVKDGALNSLYINSSNNGLELINSGSSEINFFFRASEEVVPTELNKLTGNATQFSFPNATVQPENNIFAQNLIAVATGSNQETFLVVADAAGKALAAKGYSSASEKEKAAATYIVVNPESSFAISKLEAPAGCEFIAVKGDKINETYEKDKGYVPAVNATYTISMPDKLNQPGVYNLVMGKVKYVNNGAFEEGSEENYTVAVHTPVKGQAPAYVTLVSEVGEGDNAQAKLDNSVLVSAKDLLKEGAKSVVTIQFTTGDKSTEEGVVTEYDKFLTSTSSTGSNYSVYAPVYAVNAVNSQWYITNVDADNNNLVTLVNRETAQKIQASFYTTETAGEYKMVVTTASAKLTGLKYNDGNSDQTDKDLTQGLTVRIANVETDKNDGFEAYTASQLNMPAELYFTGENGLVVSDVFMNITSADALEAVNESKGLTWTLSEVKDADKDVEYVLNEKAYAYLKDGKVVTDGVDTTQVVTKYTLSAKANNKTYYLKSETDVLGVTETEGDATDYVFKKNANGTISMIEYSTDFAGTVANEGVVYDVTSKSFKAVKTSNDMTSKSSAIVSWNATASFDKSTHVQLISGFTGVASLENNQAVLKETPVTLFMDSVEVENTIPYFYISTGIADSAERNYLFNSIDSTRVYDSETATEVENPEFFLPGTKDARAIFSAAEMKSNDEFVVATKAVKKEALNAFRFHVVLADEASNEYIVKSLKGGYLYQLNNVLGFTNNANEALRVEVKEVEAPTSNESVSASEAAVVAQNGSIVVKNAAGKNVVVSTILGQVVANEVLTSDNATINVPAGIVVVAVEGESFKVNVK